MLKLNIYCSCFSCTKILFFFMKKQALMNKITLSNRKKCHSKKMSQFC